MNKKEVFQLILMIEDLYNNPFTRNVGYLDPKETKEDKLIKVVNAWHEMLSNQDNDDVLNRFKNYVRVNKFPPTVADLYEEPSNSLVNHEHLAYMRRLRSGQLD